MSETWTAEQIGALIRQCFVSERGELVVADFAQIEPRTTLWLAGDEGNLEVFRRQDAKVGPDAYLVAASRLYGEPVTDKADKRRQAGKVAVIACGYQAGPDTVEKWAAKQGIDLAGAGTSGVAIVESWRGSTPLVAGREVGREFLDDKGRIRQVRKGGFWRQIENQAWLAIEGEDGRPFYYEKGDLFYELPSGRYLRYRQARIEPVLKPGGKVKDAITFFNAEKNRRTSTYGGKLTENVVQAIDRDLLAAAIVRVENEVAPVVMHTHDELVADSADPEGDLVRILKIMTTPPAWAAGLPIAAEGGHHRRYAK